jgi:hypothetical protein
MFQRSKTFTWGIEPFQPEIIAAHGLLIFTMYTDDSVTSSTGYRDYGFALSVESRREVGEGYPSRRDSVQAHGVSTRRHRGSGATSHQIEGHESDALIEAHEGPKNGARESTATVNGGYDGRWYHSMTDSCYTACVDLLNDVLEPEQKMARWTNFLKLGSVDIVAFRRQYGIVRQASAT